MSDKTITELAQDAFDKAERVHMLSIMNTPRKYHERKQAFVDLALARVSAREAENALRDAVRLTRVVPDDKKTPEEKANVEARWI